MPICGNCHNHHDTANEVRVCYQARYPSNAKLALEPQSPETPTEPRASGAPSVDIRAAAQSIPNARYALQLDGGAVSFYEVRQGKKTQAGRDWTGFTFLDQLYGAPGEFSHTTIRRGTGSYADVIKAISSDPEGALRLFGQKTKTCGKCASPLTHPQSRCAGYGGKCAANYGYWYPTLAEALDMLGEVQLPDGSFVTADKIAKKPKQAKLSEATYDVTNVR